MEGGSGETYQGEIWGRDNASGVPPMQTAEPTLASPGLYSRHVIAGCGHFTFVDGMVMLRWLMRGKVAEL